MKPAAKPTRRVLCSHCAGRGYIEWDGARLRQKREAAGLSLRAVARAMKFTASYLCDVELDRRHATEKIRAYYDTL